MNKKALKSLATLCILLLSTTLHASVRAPDQQEVDVPPAPCVREGETLPVVPRYECCPGLEPIGCERPEPDGSCPLDRCIGASFCAVCGNGRCGPGENKCNCPGDCAEETTTSTTTISLCAGACRCGCGEGEVSDGRGSAYGCRDSGCGILGTTPEDCCLETTTITSTTSSTTTVKIVGEGRGGGGAIRKNKARPKPATSTTLTETTTVKRSALTTRPQATTSTVKKTTSTLITSSTVVRPSCSDGIRNQGESGVDCGGPCSQCPQEKVTGRVTAAPSGAKAASIGLFAILLLALTLVAYRKLSG